MMWYAPPKTRYAYIRENITEFRFGDETVAALRLEGEFVEGV